MKRSRSQKGKREKRSSVFIKILVLFNIILVTVVILVAYYITEKFSEIIRQKEILIGDNAVEKLADYANKTWDCIYGLSNYIHGNGISDVLRDVTAGLSTGYRSEEISLFNSFCRGANAANPDISDIILLSADGYVYTFTDYRYSGVNPGFHFIGYPAVAELLDSDDQMRIQYENPSVYKLKKEEPVISFLGKIYDATLFPRKVLAGAFIINIPSSGFRVHDLFGENTDSGGELYLLDSENIVLYCTDESRIGETYPGAGAADGGYVKAKNAGASGLTALYHLSGKAITGEISRMKRNIASAMAAAIAATFAGCYLIARVFKKRTQALIDAMDLLQQGNFDLRIPITAYDEIGIVSRRFNQMCENLNHYISQVYTAELRRKDAELNALQAQIDPHFLYNTLESIRANAVQNGDEGTAGMVSLLGNLFRWSSRKGGRFSMLEDEIDYIETYLRLQKYRFGERLTVDLRIPEDCLELAVPRLILQPIAENVLKHNPIDEGKGIRIGITAERNREEEVLEIHISDNGKGMEENRCHQLKERIHGGEAYSGVGLVNVQERLELLYAEKGTLRIESAVGKGTTVTIRIPVREEEQDV